MLIRLQCQPQSLRVAARTTRISKLNTNMTLCGVLVTQVGRSFHHRAVLPAPAYRYQVSNNRNNLVCSEGTVQVFVEPAQWTADRLRGQQPFNPMRKKLLRGQPLHAPKFHRLETWLGDGIFGYQHGKIEYYTPSARCPWSNRLRDNKARTSTLIHRAWQRWGG